MSMDVQKVPAISYITTMNNKQKHPGDFMSILTQTITQQDTMSNTQHITYDGFFANKIMSAFYSPDRTGDDAMKVADFFRGEEWRLDDDAPYAENTRNDLYELGANDLRLSVFIGDVIYCMRYNRSQEVS